MLKLKFSLTGELVKGEVQRDSSEVEAILETERIQGWWACSLHKVISLIA